MKKTQKILSVILVILLAVSQMTLVSFASGESAELIGITVGNLAVPDFDPAQTEYEVEVPYKYTENDFDTVIVPEVKAFAASSDATVNITQPEDIDSVAQIEVICGEETMTYTVSFTKSALNMFEDGGFETAATFGYYRTIGFTSSQVTDNPKAGQGALTHSNTVWSPLWAYPSSIVAKAGTTHLVTYYTRDPQNSGKSWYAGNKGTYSEKAYYNEDGSTRNGDGLGKLGTSWTRVIQTYVPSSDLSGGSMAYGPITMSAAVPIEIDEMYIAPLVVTDIIYTGSNTVVVPVEGEESITLSSELKNQIGGTHGLENLNVTYSLVGDYAGVSLDGDILTVDSSAVKATAVVKMTVTHSLDGEEKTISNFVPIEIKVPEPSEAELLGIRLGGLSIPDFNPLIKDYHFKVPYRYIPGDFETVEVPTVSYIARNSEAQVDITYPDSVHGGVITIDVTAGDDFETYTVSLSPVGLNVYDDGSFETDAWVNANNYRTDLDGSSIKLSDLSPKAGNYALSYSVPYGKMLYAPMTPKLTGGITYLHSVFVRQPGGEGVYMYDGSSGSDVRKYYDENGNVKSGDGVSGLIEEWRQLVSTHLANTTKDFISSPFHYNSTNTFTAELDDNFLAPMVVTGITYTGDTIDVTIPEEGKDAVSVSLSARMRNALGSGQGLENSKVVFGFAEEYPGISIENNRLIVTDAATDGPVIITMTADTSFESVQGKIVNIVEGYLHTASQNAEIPKVRNLSADRMREVSGYVVKGSYQYYQALGESEGATRILWQHSPVSGGGFIDIPDSDTLIYDVPQEYADHYLRFSVIPVTESGTDGMTYYSNVIEPPSSPVASNVYTEGTMAVGEVIKGIYTYNDANGDEENGTEFMWLVSDSEHGPFAPITGETNQNYVIKEEDINRYLAFRVIPKTLTEPCAGTAVSSSSVLGAAYPSVTDVKIDKKSNSVYAVTYKYNHPCNITEGATRVEWFADGKLIKTGNSVTLNTIPSHLAVTVSPVAAKAPFDGTPVTVNADTAIDTSGKVTRPSGGGGGGGSFGGGKTSGVIVAIPEVKKEEPPKEEIKPERHWAADGIDFCKQNGIMQNYDKDDFGNAQIVTRAQLVSYIIKAIGAKETEYKNGFGDVSVRDYYSGALQTAVDMGIISEAENFEPDRNVSRQEVCKILVTAFENDIQNTTDLTRFEDSFLIGEWAKDYVSKAVSKGLLKGVSENSFDPLGFVTREQTAVIIHRLCSLRNGGNIK